MRGRRLIFLTFLFLVLLFVFLPKFLLIPHLAESIGQRLQGEFRAEKVAVEIRSPWGFELFRGEIPCLEVVLERALVNGLTVQELQIRGHQVRFDPIELLRKGEFSSYEALDLQARLHISQEDLNTLFWSRVDPERYFHLTLEPGEVGLEGQVDFWNIPLDLKLKGILEIQGDSVLRFVPHNLELQKTRIPPFLLEALNEYYSFSFDLEIPPYAVTISEVELEKGRLMMGIGVAE
ncbi:MAG: DUF2993 domain-containing protein [Firmicutes bacterium]|nr:DUF2993 domain-containing protein [Bacillota bacterium]